MSQTAGDWYNSLPKVSRCYLTAAFLATCATTFKIVSPYKLVLDYSLVFYKFQIWRLVSCFVWLGPFSLPFVMKLFFLAKYGPELEKNSFNGNSADFFYMMLLGGFTLLGINWFIGQVLLGDAMIFMLIYVWSRRNIHVNMSFYGLFQFKAPYFPWVLVLFSLLMGGDPILDLMGIAVGHLYYFFADVVPTQPNGLRLIKTPSFIRERIGTSFTGSNSATQGGAYAGAQQRAPAQQQPGMGGYHWGAGRRLGRD
eukprot:tig00000829_g4662.t1